MALPFASFPVLACFHRSSSKPFFLPPPAVPRSPPPPPLPARRLGDGVRLCSVRQPSQGGGGGAEEAEEISRATLLWRAVKLPMYSVALVPLTVGSTVGFLETGIFLTRRYVILLLSSFLIIAWLNLSNDVYDYDTGADRNKKESVVNMVGSRNATQLAANVSLALGFTGLIFASLKSRDVRTILLLTSAILCGYMYQCPPFRLSYKGLGEPLCFSAFGPFATTAFYFSQGGRHLPSGVWQLPLTGTIFSASLLVGLTTSLILFCSHFHQIEGDLAVGKMSPLVRIGTKEGAQMVKIAIIFLYSSVAALGLAKVLPFTCVCFTALTLPVGKLVVDFVTNNHSDKVKIFMAKYYCVRLHVLFGVALTAGLVLARKGATVHVPRLLIS